MVVCPWCGQNTQSDNVCDWCKRPIDRKIGPPAGTRNDLDFLKEEADTERNNVIRWVLVGVCAVACGAALFFVLRGTNPAPDTAEAQSPDGGPPRSQPVAQVTPAASARLVSMPEMQDHRPDYWIQQWNSGADLITNARGADWTRAAPMARGSADVKLNVPLNSPVKIQNVALTVITLPNGDKRAVGKADIVNSAPSNVIDYRIELVWADKDYTMMPLEGSNKALHQVYYKALRPGKRQTIQLVSLKIHQHPDGTPNAVRLTSWLDGNPGTAIDEYPIMFGH